MGCIYFETLIWLLYGNVELERFGQDLGTERRFYSIDESRSNTTSAADVHPAVRKWAEWMLKDPRCRGETAVGQLLRLVMDRFLVVEVGDMHKFRRTYSV